MQIYPYKFQPIYKERIWGGRNLQRLFGRQLPEGKKIGESWELADLPEGTSVLTNGPAAGATLTELTALLGGMLLGRRTKAMPDGRFPLLLKFLDSEDILSLQVHPDAAAAAEIGGGAAAKTECWYVIESRSGFIYKGVKPGVTAERFLSAIRADKVQDVVRRIDCKAGDFHYIPSGMVHALCGGLVVAEVQTPSDTTFRITDWGRGRDINVEQSLRCIRYDLGDQYPHGNAPQDEKDNKTLIATEYFIVAHRRADAMSLAPLPPGQCRAIMVLEAAGQTEIRHAGTVERVVPAAAGETILLPAALGGCVLTTTGGSTWLEIALPKNK